MSRGTGRTGVPPVHPSCPHPSRRQGPLRDAATVAAGSSRRLASSARPPGFASSLGYGRRLTPTVLPGPFARSGATAGLAPLAKPSETIGPSPTGRLIALPTPSRRPPTRANATAIPPEELRGYSSANGQPPTKAPSIEEGAFVHVPSIGSAGPVQHTPHPCISEDAGPRQAPRRPSWAGLSAVLLTSERDEAELVVEEGDVSRGVEGDVRGAIVLWIFAPGVPHRGSGRPERLPFISSPRQAGGMERSGHSCWAQSPTRSASRGSCTGRSTQSAASVPVHPVWVRQRMISPSRIP